VREGDIQPDPPPGRPSPVLPDKGLAWAFLIRRVSAVTPLVNPPAVDDLHQPGAKPRLRHTAESGNFPHQPRAVGDRQSDSIQVQHRCPQSEMPVSQIYNQYQRS
jgi:hypothetical protein